MVNALIVVDSEGDVVTAVLAGEHEVADSGPRVELRPLASASQRAATVRLPEMSLRQSARLAFEVFTQSPAPRS